MMDKLEEDKLEDLRNLRNSAVGVINYMNYALHNGEMSLNDYVFEYASPRKEWLEYLEESVKAVGSDVPEDMQKSVQNMKRVIETFLKFMRREITFSQFLELGVI